MWVCVYVGGEASLDIQYLLGVAVNISTVFWSVAEYGPYNDTFNQPQEGFLQVRTLTYTHDSQTYRVRERERRESVAHIRDNDQRREHMHISEGKRDTRKRFCRVRMCGVLMPICFVGRWWLSGECSGSRR